MWRVLFVWMAVGCGPKDIYGHRPSYYNIPSAQGYRALCQTWVGDDVNDLIRSWGDPATTGTMPNGHPTYTYVRETQYWTDKVTTKVVDPDSGKTVWRTSPSEKVVRKCETTFETNASGEILHARWNGSLCEAKPPKPPTVNAPVVAESSSP